jgi:hypothetical protein
MADIVGSDALFRNRVACGHVPAISFGEPTQRLVRKPVHQEGWSISAMVLQFGAQRTDGRRYQ